MKLSVNTYYVFMDLNKLLIGTVISIIIIFLIYISIALISIPFTFLLTLLN